MTAPGGHRSFDTAIVLNVKLSVVARMLYVVLIALADDRRECERSRAELTEESGLSGSSVQRALRELLAAGIVEVHPSRNVHGGHASNVYRVLDTPWVSQTQGGVPETQGLGLTDSRGHESPAQTLGSHRLKGLGLTDPRGVESQGIKGSLLYKKGVVPLDTDAHEEVDTPVTTKHIQHTTAATPAPEGRPMRTMRNFNSNPKDITAATSAPTRARRGPVKSTNDPDFDRAWALYAHPVDKAQARKSWTRALKKTTAETILAAIPAYVAVSLGKNDPERRGVDWLPRRKNFSTWLNNSGWEEDYTPAEKPGTRRAGTDAHDPEVYVEHTKSFTIKQLLRNGPTAGDPDLCFAWYYHWNHAKQAGWTREQLLATGNTPEDVDRLMAAYRDGIDQALYREFLDAFEIDQDGANR